MAIAGLRCSSLLVLISLVGVATPHTIGQGRSSERVLTSVGREDGAFFAFPKPGEEQLRLLLTLIARSARVPIGFEEVAGRPTRFDGNLSSIPSAARTLLIGLTVGEALDVIVSADPRYRWREQDGVILIRPVEAWTDPAHFLNQGLDGFRLRDSTASDVAKVIYSRFSVKVIYGEGGVLGDPPGPDVGLERRLALDVPPGTTIEALNSVVRAHGELGWMVHYAHAQVDIRSSCLRFITFDGKFTGVGAAECQSIAGIRTASR